MFFYLAGGAIIAAALAVLWGIWALDRPLPETPKDWQDYGERQKRIEQRERDRTTFLT